MKVSANILDRLHTKVENHCVRVHIFMVTTNMSREQCREIYRMYISLYKHILNCECVNVQFKHANVIRLMQYEYHIYERVISGGS